MTHLAAEQEKGAGGLALRRGICSNPSGNQKRKCTVSDSDLNVSFVAIGRNEGERLISCLRSICKASEQVVYVDSGSSDGSVAAARELGAKAVALTEGQAFTAARARNAGFKRAMECWPETDFVMFIDGDCELIDGFIERATDLMRRRPEVGIVTGRCRERKRDASVYNLVCDMEWDGPVGDVDACGGIFMTRVSTFQSAGGFRPFVLAAEDDDYCIRVRNSGFFVHRLRSDMCWHDADMNNFGQWWRRAKRAGHAYAQLGELHNGYFQAERMRAWFWGAILPLSAIAFTPLTRGLSLLLLLLFPLSFVRTAWNLVKGGAAARDAAVHSAFLTISKFPNLLGILNYQRKKAFGSAAPVDTK